MGFGIANDEAADRVLDEHAFAPLVGMLLDQQYGMEHAFRGPWKILDRFGSLDPATIAAADPEEFTALCSQPPAIHRFPASMAVRVQGLALIIVDEYGGDPARLWNDAPSGQELLRRVMALPGFGRQKAQIFLALLGKQYGVRPEGWREAAGAYGEEGSHRSVADITGPESLARVRAFKQEMKAAAKSGK
jgi:uncharacterized HhH-GPD family protein